MNILYMSVHEILEYDELKLFSELGYKCFSLGAYTQPGGDEHRKRPALELPYNPHFIELALQYPKESLHEEQLEGIDIVIIMHQPKYIEGNWPLFEKFIKRGGRVIWRAIGQSIAHIEDRLRPFRAKGLEVVRYSPNEDTIPGNVGADAMIRFYKDPAEYNGWTGTRKHVVNFTQSLKARGEFTGYRVIERVMDGLPGKVYGPGNEDLGLMSGGLLTDSQQKQVLQEARCYIYTGTYPASYTLSFIEAMMTGVPMVCVGEKLGNSFDMFGSQKTFEIPDIIHNGVDGYVSDDIHQLKKYVSILLANEGRAKGISVFGRDTAIKLFGKAKIKQEWRAFLEGGKK